MKLIDQIFEESCYFLGWKYIAGQDTWANVKDIEDKEHGKDDTDLPFGEKAKYFFLLEKKMRNILNPYGAVIGRIWSGELIIGVRSRLTDPSFEYKLLNQINPLYTEQTRIEQFIPDCEGMKMNSWSVIEEVSDAFDTNFDGLRITFEIQHDDI